MYKGKFLKKIVLILEKKSHIWEIKKITVFEKLREKSIIIFFFKRKMFLQLFDKSFDLQYH